MNCIKITKLLLRPELWETTNRAFPDELRTKDGKLRFYSEEAVRFREGYGDYVVYEVPFLAWFWINPLSQWLRHQVNRSNSE